MTGMLFKTIVAQDAHANINVQCVLHMVLGVIELGS